MRRPVRPIPDGGDRDVKRPLRAATIATCFLALVLVPGTALAHDEMEEEEPGHDEGAATEPDRRMDEPSNAEEAAEAPEAPLLELQLPDGAELGSRVTLRASLVDPHDGEPIPDAEIAFEALAVWGEHVQGWMALGVATTDEDGVAVLATRVRATGALQVRAGFEGGDGYAPASAGSELEIQGDAQLVEPQTGLRVPWLNLWVLAAVIGLVWALYLLVGIRILAITRPRAAGSTGPRPASVSRRSFLARALPLGAQAGIAAMGTGLVTVVARSPRTHGNLLAPPATAGYHRTPVAHLGQGTEERPMPEPLDRPVSFSLEVLPIFLANGGPHVVPPEHSPPPGGLRLDSYEGVMAKEGVVVPGKPEASELVEHLLSVGMQMPPSIPPLPTEQVQLIVTWIAQGAKDD